MNKFYKNIAMWVIIVATVVLMFNLLSYNKQGPTDTIVFSDFAESVESGRVGEITIQGNSIKGKFNDGRSFSTYAPNDPDLVSRLRAKGVRIAAEPISDSMSLPAILISCRSRCSSLLASGSSSCARCRAAAARR